MQTFLPSASFSRSARLLDDLRLGKQRVEALQILRALHFTDYGWRRHPAVLMWRGWTPALVAYGLAVVAEWRGRGGSDTTEPMIAEFAPDQPRGQGELRRLGLLPPWLGKRALHRSHQSALVRKDPVRYGPLFPGVPDDLPYVWPVPAPEPEAKPQAGERPEVVSAWVVRGAATPGSIELDLAGLAPGRRRRAEQRLLDELRPGALVAVPDWRGLLVGRAGPDATERRGSLLRRSVHWSGWLPRERLLRPAMLQDPQAVFTLRGEPALASGDPSPAEEHRAGQQHQPGQGR